MPRTMRAHTHACAPDACKQARMHAYTSDNVHRCRFGAANPPPSIPSTSQLSMHRPALPTAAPLSLPSPLPASSAEERRTNDSSCQEPQRGLSVVDLLPTHTHKHMHASLLARTHTYGQRVTRRHLISGGGDGASEGLEDSCEPRLGSECAPARRGRATAAVEEFGERAEGALAVIEGLQKLLFCGCLPGPCPDRHLQPRFMMSPFHCVIF